MWSFSIRAKLIVVVVVATCASLSLMGVALGAFELLSNRKAMVAEMQTVGEIIGANSTAALAFNDRAAASETLGALEPHRTMLAACLYDAAGRPFSTFARPGQQSHCPRAPSVDGAGFNGDVFVQSGAVSLGGERIGTLRLVASQGNLWRHMQLFSMVLGLSVAGSLFAGLILSSRLRQMVSRPVLELADTARRISDQRNYSLRAPQRGNDEVGVAVGAFNIMLDHIQDRDLALREAETKSREQAQFLTSILESMGEGMVVVDFNGKVVVWNAAATRIVGSGPVGLPLTEWAGYFSVAKGEEDELLAADSLPLARALRGEIVGDQQLYLKPTVDRTGRWLNSSARPLRDEEGQVVGAIAVFRDVTLQRQAEQDLRASEAQLRQSQKMDAVGQLAGGIAHDFNNLLTVIGGYGNFALNSYPVGAPEREDIQQVLSAGERAATLTRQLLAFSRRQVLAPQRLDLNTVVHASRQMLRRLIGENMEFCAVYGAGLGLVVADPGQVDQVILNLVVNARDAMPNGGKLTLETDNAEIDAHVASVHPGARAGAYVRLRVSDTGIGMSADVQGRIFEPFFTTKEVGRGTGLGLSTVYGIVQQSGGFIDVTSTPGAGTTFSIHWPRANGAAEVGPAAHEGAPIPRGTETVLLVEDEAPVRNLAHRILTGLGYTVLLAKDGIEALGVQESFNGTIQLLVSDVVMPRLSGVELARRLVLRLPGLPVVFISGFNADTSAYTRFPLEEPTLVTKPFTAEVLGLAVRDALDRRKLAAHYAQVGWARAGQ